MGSHFKEQMKENVYLVEIGQNHCQPALVRSQPLLQHGSSNFFCPADCGDPGIPQNGRTSVSDTTVGALANHTCDDGFVPRGTTQRECLPNGEWSGSLPMCVGKITKAYKYCNL